MKKQKIQTEKLVKCWFEKWEKGEFMELPIAENFRHVSPFGIIKGKEAYLSLVKTNRDKFLGYRFEIHDQLFWEDKACVRYTGIQKDFHLDVSEWYYLKQGLIKEVFAYYHIGEIREERKLHN